MNKISVSLGGALLALLLLASGCSSPLSNLVGSNAGASPLAADEVRLVISVGDTATSERAVIADAGYMTLQLKSVADGTVKYAAATGSAGTFTFTLKGLVAGAWNLRSMFYDSEVGQELLFYGNTTTQISVGTSRNVTIAVKEPGTIGGVNVVLEAPAQHVNVFDANGFNGSTARILPTGTVWPLFAEVWSDAAETLPATQSKVLWSSSDETVAQVSSTGKVTVLKAGTATIDATAVDDESVSVSYLVEGVVGVLGTWKMVTEDDSVVIVYGTSTYTQYEWDSRGQLNIIQGTYTLSGNVLSHDATSRLNKSTGAFVASASDYDELGQVMVEVNGDTLAMSVPDNRAVNAFMPTFYLTRAPYKDLTGITVTGQSGANVSIPVGSTFEQKGVTLNPSDATFGAVYWKSANTAVIDWDPSSDRFVVKTSNVGAVSVSAYALDDLVTPLVVYNVSTPANTAPTVTVATNEIVTNSPWPTIDITVSDDVGIASIALINDGNVSNVENTGLGAGTHQKSIVATLADGVHAVRVLVTDTQGQVTYSDPIAVYIDTVAPIFYLTGKIGIADPLLENANTNVNFSLDSMGGPATLDTGSVAVTSDVGTITGLTDLGSGYYSFTFNATGVMGDGNLHWIKIVYQDNYGNKKSVFLDFYLVSVQA